MIVSGKNRLYNKYEILEIKDWEQYHQPTYKFDAYGVKYSVNIYHKQDDYCLAEWYILFENFEWTLWRLADLTSSETCEYIFENFGDRYFLYEAIAWNWDVVKDNYDYWIPETAPAT